MQFLLYLIQKNRNFLLFFVLELIALFFTIQFHSYKKSKFINSANSITGGVYNSVTSFRSYLHLADENELLVQENRDLKNSILKQTSTFNSPKDSVDIQFNQKFEYVTAKIINNDFHKQNNFLTIDKGTTNSIESDMAIVNAKGIIGITFNTSSNYSSAISVLNTKFKVNARLKKSSFFGTLNWNGKSHHNVQLIDIPRQASIIVGDTIVTGGRSAIFPEGILIGEISDIKYTNNRYEEINIRLFNDVRNVTNVYIIKNLHKNEILELEQQNNE